MVRSNRFACVLLALLVVFTAVECRASMEPMDARGEVKVGNVQPPEGGGGELADAADAMQSRLVVETFKIETISGPVPDPRDHLRRNPDVIHLITDLRPGPGGRVSATHYTRGAVTPRSFGAAPVETLVACGSPSPGWEASWWSP